MASKVAKVAMSSAHTAGIYADMSLDGPEIGTLVIIVDRAKNLPNRKSMGKQDPYCAARLGKQARKTATDKRGGQTPRWDQELRFTVHDSPDYYQLKVSVFNDDKKTDLIGETWIQLDTVVVPGGGQNDLWHNLNFKGRYAGEIRIELTYYDTRPKDEQAQAMSAMAAPVATPERPSDAVGGPRQPKPLKRRPLPADPTSTDSSPSRPVLPDQAHSSPLPYTSPNPHQFNSSGAQSAHGPSGYMIPSESQAPRGYGPSPSQANGAYGHGTYNQAGYTESQGPYSTSHGDLQLPRESDQHSAEPGHGQQSGRSVRQPYHMDYQDPYRQPIHEASSQLHQSIELPPLPPHQPRSSRSSLQSSSAPYDRGGHGRNSSPAIPLPHYHSAPTFRQQHRLRENQPRHSLPGVGAGERHREDNPRHSLPNSTMNPYQEPLAHHDSFDSGFDNTPQPPTEFHDEGPPPPPPAHRSSGTVARYREEPDRQHDYAPVAAPAPLNIRQGRTSVSPSPLSQSYTDYPELPYPLAASNLSTQLSSIPAPPTASYPEYHQPSRHASHEDAYPNQLHHPQVPPSLVAGYDPVVAEVESERSRRERRMSAMPSEKNNTSIRSRSPASEPLYGRNGAIEPLYGNAGVPEPFYDDQRAPEPLYGSQRPQHTGFAVPPPAEDIIGHHTPTPAPAPLIKPRAVSPNPQTPHRRSISPHPEHSPQEARGFSAFSPDSYETLNPTLSAAKAINTRGPLYSTPEEVREAARVRELEERLEEGPIIGTDGRTIDPSDHLPTDTWAPEPERKPPRRGPEITLRFRNAPQQPSASGPRPLRETVIRPHATPAATGPAYPASEDVSTSPTAAAGRNRLQKKNRLSPTHVHASPVLPTSTGTSPYPLREHVNYGYGSSPGPVRRSPGGGPPVPAKVPLGTGQEDWNAELLSEEMRRAEAAGERARRR